MFTSIELNDYFIHTILTFVLHFQVEEIIFSIEDNKNTHLKKNLMIFLMAIFCLFSKHRKSGYTFLSSIVAFIFMYSGIELAFSHYMRGLYNFFQILFQKFIKSFSK